GVGSGAELAQSGVARFPRPSGVPSGRATLPLVFMSFGLGSSWHFGAEIEVVLSGVVLPLGGLMHLRFELQQLENVMRLKVTMGLFWVLVSCIVAVGEDQEAKVLKGMWKATSYVEDGETAARLDKTPIRWEFDGNRVTIRASDQEEFLIKG